jgi:5'-methylthioadenosine phosphorylase
MIGIIGGSGLYDIEELREARDEEVATPFAPEKVRVRRGRLGDVPVAFLARHGPGHRYPPGGVAYRANLDALKRIGVTDVVSLSACGSLREDLSPGTFVLVDQFVDRTKGRPHSFFERGLVAHVSLAHPTCARLRGLLHEVASALPVPVVAGATYLAMEGPQFSTLAESRLYRTWGCDVIGMTNMPEARDPEVVRKLDAVAGRVLRG